MSKLSRRYAQGLMVWQQLGVFLSIANGVMITGLFYQNIASHYVPLWAFMLGTALVLAGVVVFIVKVGIPAYYDYFRKLNRLDVIEDSIKERQNGE